MGLNRRLVYFGVISVIGLSVLVGWTKRVQQGSTWSLHFDDLEKNGTEKTSLSVRFVDILGKKQVRTITATTQLLSTDGADTKRQKVEKELQQEIEKHGNKFEGVELVIVGGQGNVLNF